MTDPILRVSVIIPTYNRADVLPRAIESALKQKDCSVEIIVVDDGSTDQTIDRLKIYKEKIKYVYQENKGASAARNLGIAKSTGDFIAFLDSDDFFISEENLKLKSELLESNLEYGMTYSSVNFFGEGMRTLGGYSGKELTGHIYPDLLFIKNNIIFTPTVMVRRDVLSIVGGFDESMHLCEDIDLWRRISKIKKIYQFKDVFCAVTIRENEKYNIGKAVKWRNYLYLKAYKEDKEFSVVLLLRLYLELFLTMYSVILGRIIQMIK